MLNEYICCTQIKSFATIKERKKKELKKVQSKSLEIPEKDLQAIIKNAENYFAKEARKEEKISHNQPLMKLRAQVLKIKILF